MTIEPRTSFPIDPELRTPGAGARQTEPWTVADRPESGASDDAAAVPVAAPGATPANAPVATTEPADRQAALRALRSLEATEARLERNARREAEEARAKLVGELLPVLDNLDRTIRAAQAGRSDPAMLEGVRMVRQQLEGVLRGYGVERVESLGQRFDPAVHEAVGMIAVDDPQRHGVVVHQAEPGYRFGARLLRPAKISVGKLASPFELRQRAAWR